MVQYFYQSSLPRARLDSRVYLKDTDSFQELVALENEIINQYLSGSFRKGTGSDLKILVWRIPLAVKRWKLPSHY